MSRFRITKQNVFFSGSEQITEKNRTHSTEIDADNYKKIFDEVLINNDNLEYARKYLNPNYKVGDIHKSPVKSISFIKNDIDIDSFNILADPYYKLEEFIDGDWKIIDAHKCIQNK